MGERRKWTVEEEGEEKRRGWGMEGGCRWNGWLLGCAIGVGQQGLISDCKIGQVSLINNYKLKFFIFQLDFVNY